MRLKLALVFALTLLVMCSTSSFAVAELFSMTYGQGAPGVGWIYKLTNNDTTGNVVVTGLDIVWDPAVPSTYYTVTGTPTGWVENPSFGWPAWDAVVNDPEPGESLSGFSFTAPTAAPYFTVYYNVLTDSLYYDGEATPEPSSLLALLSGVGVLGAMIKRRIA